MESIINNAVKMAKDNTNEDINFKLVIESDDIVKVVLKPPEITLNLLLITDIANEEESA